MDQQKPRIQFIIENLFEEVDNGKFNSWEQGFINDMADRLDKLGSETLEYRLTDGQKSKLEELWKK